MEYLDLETWPRRKHFEMFKAMDYPHFSVCANLNISGFAEHVKKKGISFYSAMIYLAAKTANGIEEFRYRMRDGKVAVHEMVHPSFTILEKGETAFSYCTVEFVQDAQAFFRGIASKLLQLKGKTEVDDEPGRDDLLYITCLPWVSFTSVTHPVHMHPADSIPRISWGRYFSEGNELKLPFSVQANHALMDGFHVGKYFNAMQEQLDLLVEGDIRNEDRLF